MGLFKKLFQWRKKKEEPEYEGGDWENIVFNRDDYRIDDKDQRQEYVNGCLDQIAEATKELENLEFEYNMVTSYLKDMEEIEALPEDEMAELIGYAQKIQSLEKQQTDFKERKNPMDEALYRRMERMEDDLAEGVEKLAKAEEYQDLVKRDLRKLDGEKQAYLFRRSELHHLIADTRSMTVVCTVAVIACILILFVLQYGFRMNTKVGYLLAAAVGATAITAIFVKHNNGVKELAQVENGINRIISLQNTVKIRYVNNTNLLNYLYLKYEVGSAGELAKSWQQYQEEKEIRHSYKLAEQQLDICQKDMLHFLRGCQIKDPMVWLHQTAALIDKREMVEIRHGLIIRRQSLRRRMDYNKEVIAARAQAEIKDLVDKYPKYAGEIMKAVSSYEKNFS